MPDLTGSPLRSRYSFYSIFLSLIAAAQIAVALAEGYLAAYAQVSGSWPVIAAVLFIPESVLSVVGFVIGLLCVVKRKSTTLSAILIITSLCTFPIAGTAIVRPIIEPIATSIARRNFYRAMARNKDEYDSAQKNLREDISAEFRRPQKVAIVDDEYSVLILKNGAVVSLPAIPDARRSDFVSWARTTLVNQEVSVSLTVDGPAVRFLPCRSGAQGLVLAVRRKHKIPDDKGGICSVISAPLSFKGEYISILFDRSPAGIEARLKQASEAHSN